MIRLGLGLAIGLAAGCMHRQPSRPADDRAYRIVECRANEAQTALTFTCGVEGVFDPAPSVFYFRRQFRQAIPGKAMLGQGRAVRIIHADGPGRWTRMSIGVRGVDKGGVTISTTCSYSVGARRGSVDEDIWIPWGDHVTGRIGELSYKVEWQGHL